MQLKSIWGSLALVACVSACSINVNVNDTQLIGETVSEEDQILSVLSTQQDAWNSGDIDGFMSGYWVSPELRFASGGSVTYGWQATLDRYKTNYSDRALMGTLSFDALEVELLSDDAAIVHGAWPVERDGIARRACLRWSFETYQATGGLSATQRHRRGEHGSSPYPTIGLRVC